MKINEEHITPCSLSLSMGHCIRGLFEWLYTEHLLLLSTLNHIFSKGTVKWKMMQSIYSICTLSKKYWENKHIGILKYFKVFAFF